VWETISPESLGWCKDKIDSLYNFLQQKNSKAFLVLKDGRIVLEKYFDSFTQDSIWYWASAGKTLTSLLVGIAQEEGYLSITDSTSKYLGAGWTSEPPEKEKLITIRNQLTMTSGLNDLVADPYCTDPACLVYKADAGTRWAYHNAPYTLLDEVIKNATGKNFNLYFNDKIRSKTGMNGIWLPSGYNNVYYSNARSMARYGILIQNNAVWNNDTLLHDSNYFNAMVITSQQLNKSYGYLWWLAGKESFMLPGTQFIFNGTWAPDAPPDMFAALGKNGQILNVVPSLGLVMVRMGNPPDSSVDVAVYLNNQIWQKLNEVICNQTYVENENTIVQNFLLEQNYPNPFNPSTIIKFTIPASSLNPFSKGEGTLVSLKIYDILGNEVATLVNEEKPAGSYEVEFSTGSFGNAAHLSSGMYFYNLTVGNFSETKKMIFLK
jgi:CubicO group peptidase (beta-lactamase class C family)